MNATTRAAIAMARAQGIKLAKEPEPLKLAEAVTDADKEALERVKRFMGKGKKK